MKTRLFPYTEGHLSRFHHALSFYSKNKKERINQLKIHDEPTFRMFVPEQIEKRLYFKEYISDDKNECLDPYYMITFLGDKSLRELNEGYYRDWKFWLAIAAFILAFFDRFFKL